eukprot:gb/GECH01010874.1/.p1 GENE.gb/GECH01010874.1/~~gb/GECH01010874.1/.p1  ORF type:complete len:1208 (+),score=205.25 gb/GECH01010874.1/:1-3624(+)
MAEKPPILSLDIGDHGIKVGYFYGDNFTELSDETGKPHLNQFLIDKAKILHGSSSALTQEASLEYCTIPKIHRYIGSSQPSSICDPEVEPAKLQVQPLNISEKFSLYPEIFLASMIQEIISKNQVLREIFQKLHIVMNIPDEFNVKQQKALKTSAMIAGFSFERIHLTWNSLSCAMSMFLGNKTPEIVEDPHDFSRLVVIDFGYSSLKVSFLEASNVQSRKRRNDGNEQKKVHIKFLGNFSTEQISGFNHDQQFADIALNEIKEAEELTDDKELFSSVNFFNLSESLKKVKESLLRTKKKTLSKKSEVCAIYQNQEYELDVKFSKRSIQELIDNDENDISKFIKNSFFQTFKKRTKETDFVFCTGGCSGINHFKNTVESLFPFAEKIYNNSVYSTSHGAALLTLDKLFPNVKNTIRKYLNIPYSWEYRDNSEFRICLNEDEALETKSCPSKDQVKHFEASDQPIKLQKGDSVLATTCVPENGRLKLECDSPTEFRLVSNSGSILEWNWIGVLDSQLIKDSQNQIQLLKEISSIWDVVENLNDILNSSYNFVPTNYYRKMHTFIDTIRIKSTNEVKANIRDIFDEGIRLAQNWKQELNYYVSECSLEPKNYFEINWDSLPDFIRMYIGNISSDIVQFLKSQLSEEPLDFEFEELWRQWEHEIKQLIDSIRRKELQLKPIFNIIEEKPFVTLTKNKDLKCLKSEMTELDQIEQYLKKNVEHRINNVFQKLNQVNHDGIHQEVENIKNTYTWEYILSHPDKMPGLLHTLKHLTRFATWNQIIENTANIENSEDGMHYKRFMDCRHGDSLEIVENFEDQIEQDREILRQIPKSFSDCALDEMAKMESRKTMESYLRELNNCKIEIYRRIINNNASYIALSHQSLKSIYHECYKHLKELLRQHFHYRSDQRLLQYSFSDLYEENMRIQHEIRRINCYLNDLGMLLKSSDIQEAEHLPPYKKMEHLKLCVNENVENLKILLKKHSKVKNKLQLYLLKRTPKEQASYIQSAVGRVEELLSNCHPLLKKALNPQQIIEWSYLQFRIMEQIEDRSKILYDLDLIENNKHLLLTWRRNDILSQVHKYREQCLKEKDVLQSWNDYKKSLIKEMEFYQNYNPYLSRSSTMKDTLARMKKPCSNDMFEQNIRDELKWNSHLQESWPTPQYPMTWGQALMYFDVLAQKGPESSRKGFFQWLLKHSSYQFLKHGKIVKIDHL